MRRVSVSILKARKKIEKENRSAKRVNKPKITDMGRNTNSISDFYAILQLFLRVKKRNV